MMPAENLSCSELSAGRMQEDVDGLDVQLIVTECMPEFGAGARFRDRRSWEIEVVTEDRNRRRLRILGW